MQEVRRYPDLLLVMLVLVLFALGLTALYSAGGEERFWMQVQRGALGVVLMLGVAMLPVHWLRSITPAVFLAILLLLVAVLFFGVKINNTRRWLNVGVLLQPSEFMKIALPLFIAYCYSHWRYPVRWWKNALALLLILPPVWLVMRQPDLGTAVMIIAAGMAAVWFGGIRLRWLMALLTAGIIALPLLWQFVLKPYQKQRILTVMDPLQDPLGAGYHIIQSKIAIGSGGFWGKGFLSGTQTQGDFLPERHTDFIFAVFAEEFGLVGGCALLLLACLIAWRCLYIAGCSSERFAYIAAAGIAAVFFMTFTVNLSMASGLLPVVGMPLPLVSYGGTALLSTFIGFGVVLSASRYRRR